MVSLALTVLAFVAAGGAIVVLRRRRASRAFLQVQPRVTPAPAGLQHLARTLSDLSDVGLHLRAERSSGKPRLGSLLGVR